jgi:alpha-tubulin suppressor-like RCC1 family protein
MVRKTLLVILVISFNIALSFTATPINPVEAASTTNPSGVTAGFEHTCVVLNDGTVKCWGSNRYGQLGNLSLTLHPFPISVTGLAGSVTSVEAGAYHTCALISGGTVQCWGLNSSGQLGNGTLTNSPTPVTITGLAGVTQIAAGYTYTCAVINGGSSGTVICWGDNTFGQLGNGSASTTPVTTPGTVPGLPVGAKAISASLDHTCALMNDQVTLYCWGKNSYGQLGNGSVSPTPVTSPVGVSLTLSGGTTINAIAAGAQHTCALLSNGNVYCWGDGSSGQMGDGGSNLTQNPTPLLVSGVSNAVSITAGGNAITGHTCALTSAAGVVCWGNNLFGQLGNGNNTNQNPPAAVQGLTNVLAIDAGVDHTCALLTDITIQCWGSDSAGQLGDGVISFSPIAQRTGDFNAGVSQLGMGDRSTCALANGQAYCWGDNRNGQVWNSNTINQPAPVQVGGLTGTITAIDSGVNQSCAVVNGGVMCWGNLDPTTNVISPPTAIGGLPTGVTSLSMTNLEGCAVINGAVRCWGDNSYGQLGDGSITASYTSSVAVTGLTSGFGQVSTGQWFACALKGDGTVWCWGDNTNGQLGNDPAGILSSKVPLQVGGISSATLIASGQDHVCAILQNGAAKCWGNNSQGQLGDGGTETMTFVPVQVSGLTSGTSSITAGGYHTCALVSGRVVCWGFNSFGQLGNGLTTLSKVPVAAIGLGSGVVAVAAGGINYDEEQTCAVLQSGQLQCWGGDEYGQLGDNLPIMRSAPVHVLGLASLPEIGTNYTSGNIGSFFRVATTGFNPGEWLIVTSNSNYIGSIQASSEGFAIFHFADNSHVIGPVQIQITNNGASTVSTTIVIASNSPYRKQEGSGLVFYSQPRMIFLPIIFH